MMQRWIDFLGGSVTLQVRGEFPERFLNLCASREIAFWGIQWQDEHTLEIVVSQHSLKTAREIGVQVLCLVEEKACRGLPSLAVRLRRRYGFLLGLTLSMIAVFFLAQFVLTIEVEGNQQVSTAEIIWALRRQGLSLGTYGPNVDERQIANEVLLQLSGISWMSINVQGTCAQVIVRETINPPEIVDETIIGDIVAKADGMVLRIENEKGEPLVAEGSVVLEGEVLISGSIRLSVPEYSELEDQWYQVGARGTVYARTWRTIEGQIPLTGTQKEYTGECTYLCYLNFFGYRVNFYGNGGISFGKYDKINNVKRVTLPDGSELPISMGIETYQQYEVVPATINPVAAQEMIEEQLSATLLAYMGEDGVVEQVSFSTREENGMLIVTLTAECQEEIGTFVERVTEQES